MKHLIRTIIWFIVAVYAIVFIVPKIPWVQKTIAEKTQTLLSQKLGTKVSIGNTSGNQVTVLGGLEMGERVVTDGFQKLSEGTRVVY